MNLYLSTSVHLQVYLQFRNVRVAGTWSHYEISKQLYSVSFGISVKYLPYL